MTHLPRRTEVRSTETKAAYKTTELVAYVATVLAVLIAAMIVDETNRGGFGAQQAWLYVTILTAAYMISRGLAKSGSREPYRDELPGRVEHRDRPTASPTDPGLEGLR